MSAADRIEAGRFGLQSAHLVIDPKASLEDLLNDVNCLLVAGIGALETMGKFTCSVDAVPPEVHEPWWAMLYTLRQAQLVFGHVYARAHDELVPHCRNAAGSEQ